MKLPAILGILLIAIGAVALIYQGVNYTTHDTVIDLGPIKATADREHTLPLSPMLGVGALVAGVVLLTVGMRKAPKG